MNAAYNTVFERYFNAVWYQRKHPWVSLALTPIASVLQAYAQFHWRKNAPSRAAKLPVPVVVVGNIVAGGSGKTPVTQALALELKSRGLQVGIVSRGYRGTARDAVLVNPEAPEVYGDEPCLLAATTGCPVVVGRARRAAVEYLCSRFDVDIVLSDDGMQHAGLHRDFELCVIGPRGLGSEQIGRASCRERV